MKTRRLGRTGLSVSVLSYGSGGPSRLGQGTGRTPAEQDALIRRCLDLGINLFDTSAHYGESEAILGRALRGVPRDAYLIATKWSPTHGMPENRELNPSADALVESVERSLERLRVETIDVMQFHAVLPEHVAPVVDRFLPAMERLRSEGKIRFIGITERFFSDPRHEALRIALTDYPDVWDTIMVKYGILNQIAAKEVLPLAAQHDVGVLNMASVRVKLTRPSELEALLREWKSRGWLPADALPETDPLGWLVDGAVDSVVSAGYKFALDHPAVSTVLTGTSRIEHLERNLAAILGPPLSAEAKERLRALFGEIAEPV